MFLHYVENIEIRSENERITNILHVGTLMFHHIQNIEIHPFENEWITNVSPLCREHYP
jgi:hypothetical protein